MNNTSKELSVCALRVLSASVIDQVFEGHFFGMDGILVNSLVNIYHSYIYLVLGAAVVFLYYLYKLLFVPINRVIRLEDSGYPSTSYGNRPKREIANEVRRRREVGELPPVYPDGWFGLIESFNLKSGEAKHISALGLNLAVFRDENGEAHVLDAYCPHLGANIGIGGRVIGDCLQCPFHGWRFRGPDGRVTKIPYADKIPEMAKTKSWPIIERNDWIYLWFHAEGAEPTWLPSENEDITSGHMTFGGRTETYSNCHISDMAENMADSYHMNYVHPPSRIYDIIAKLDFFRTPILQYTYDFRWEQCPAPEEHVAATEFLQSRLVFGKSITRLNSYSRLVMIGPGIFHIEFEGMLLILNLLPVEPLLIKVVTSIYKRWTIPSLLSGLASISFMNELMKDAFIFNSKKHPGKPLLVKSKEDSMIAAFRRYYSQFYSENSPRLNFLKDSLDW